MSNSLNNAFKLRNIVNVMEPRFGARGNYDGISGHDDTDAFQAAIEYVESNTELDVTTGIHHGPNMLYVPPGRYKISAPLVVTKRLAIRGDDGAEFSQASRLIQTHVGDLLRFAPAGGGLSFSVENLGLLNYNFAPGPGAGHLINVLHGTPGYNSYRIRRCCFAQPQGMAIKLIGDDIQIEGNTFDVSGVSGECIQLGTNVPNENCHNVRIINNDFFNIAVHCVLHYAAYGVIFANNTISQQGGGNGDLFTYAVYDAQDTLPTLCKRVVIANNTIEGGRRLVALADARDCVISGNVASDCGIGTSETLHAISLSGVSDNIVVSGNCIHGTYNNQHFIAALGDDISNLNINGNNFWNEGGPAAAIHMGSATGKVSGNNCFQFVKDIEADSFAAIGHMPRGDSVIPYSASMTADVGVADHFIITASNGTAFTIQDALNASSGQRISYTIRNASGGALGAVTWGGGYKLAAWTSPANGFSRTIEFVSNGTHWVEQSRTPVDVPN